MKLPGFIDSHCHFLGLGYTASLVDLSKVSKKNEMIPLIKQRLHQQVIIGRGWNEEQLLNKLMLSKEDLNEISQTIPIVLIRTCGHVIIVNDCMLKQASIFIDTPQVEGGSFDFNKGIFKEKALSLIYSYLPKPSKEDLRNYLMIANKICLENGITRVASDDFSIFPVSYELIIETINELYFEKLIKVKITEQVNLPTKELLEEFIHKGYANKDYGSFKMGPLKLLADGSLGGRTAALFEDYSDDPSNKGMLTFSDAHLKELIYLADSNKMDVAIHAIGDACIDQVIDAIIYSTSKTFRTNHHHAIIHAQLASYSQIKKMKLHHIGAIVQPIFLNSDIMIVNNRLHSRSKESYLFYSMFKEGINVGFSTDAPVESINPFENLYSAITRISKKTPELGVFLEDECFSLKEALSCYRKNNLVYVGKLIEDTSDYIITDTNIYSAPFESLLHTQVLETYIDHLLVYKR